MYRKSRTNISLELFYKLVAEGLLSDVRKEIQ
jgi:hypothetical protein